MAGIEALAHVFRPGEAPGPALLALHGDHGLEHAEGVDAPVHSLSGLSHHVVARERRVDAKRLLSVDAQNELHTPFEIQAE